MGDDDTDQNATGFNANMTNLIINYLPQSLTDDEFFQLFASVGDVTSARIIRDKKTSYSFGYGFVNYGNPNDAAQAIEQLNGQLLQSKTIKVAYSQPSGFQTKNINLYVSGLPADASEERLQDHFSPFGTITQCRVIRDKNTGLCQGFGFVLFANRDEAGEAIKGLDGSLFPGTLTNNISVKFAKTEQKGPPNSYLNKASHMPYSFNTLGSSMVGRGGGPMRGHSFRGRFSPMTSARGTFSNPTTAAEGMCQNLNQSVSGDNGSNGTIVFVYGIGPHTNEDQLWDLFKSFGNIMRINVIWDHNKGLGKGYGFVTYSTHTEALFAVHSMKNVSFQGRQLQVSIKT
ncbi:ELAV-like protein 1-B [Clavelina lepadiformis]|uniref:RRM domain-containing protein n=1 Tax=Clavelina lepadiformis TaxID=159417 RepID=A0ABP0G2X3_CLALP